MKKMQKMIAVLFSVAMCAAMAVPAFAAETDTARNEEQETVMPRAIVYEEINIPGDGKFYKITDDFEMPAKSRVSFQGTWSPAYARLEFRLYAHSGLHSETCVPLMWRFWRAHAILMVTGRHSKIFLFF